MHSALVFSNNFITCITLESYLKKKGIRDIFQSNSTQNVHSYLEEHSPSYVFIDLDADPKKIKRVTSGISDDNLIRLIFIGGSREETNLPENLPTEDYFLLNKPFSSMDIQEILIPKPVEESDFLTAFHQ
jgi:AmiR/NasT family two-component response regulator